MSFDGTGYISLSADQLPTSERTISLWFYSDQIGNNNYGENLLDYGGLSCGQSFQMCKTMHAIVVIHFHLKFRVIVVLTHCSLTEQFS